MAAPRIRRTLLLAGPTASGKSHLALDLAERIGAAIVNADSMQVYRDLRILTARPSEEDEARVPHLLYGHVDGAEPYSVGRWLADVGRVLEQSVEKPLIFVGGTGLYFDALTRGLSHMPPIPETVRASWRARQAAEPATVLHAELERRDPVMAASLRPSDSQRLVRALEVLEATGRSLSEWQGKAGAPLLPDAERIVLAPERSLLRQRIAERFHRMIEEGGLQEVTALRSRGLDPELPLMKAIGVPPLLAHLAGELSLEAAVEMAITDSRQYAKRQQTWFRNRLKDWGSIGTLVEQGIFPREHPRRQ